MNSAPAEQTLIVDPMLDAELSASQDPVVVQLKNEGRLDGYRRTLRAEKSILFQTSPMSRVVRRDWNIVSAKMFLNLFDRKLKYRIQDGLMELNWQADDLLEGLKRLPMNHVQGVRLRPRLIHVQVVHPFAAQWLRCLRTLDACYEVLINAEQGKVLTRRQRWAMMAPAQLAYLAFKAAAMNQRIDGEMGTLD